MTNLLITESSRHPTSPKFCSLPLNPDGNFSLLFTPSLPALYSCPRQPTAFHSVGVDSGSDQGADDGDGPPSTTRFEDRRCFHRGQTLRGACHAQQYLEPDAITSSRDVAGLGATSYCCCCCMQYLLDVVDWELPLFSSHFDIDWSGRYLSMLDWTPLNTPCRRSSCAKHRVCAHVSTMYC